MQAVIYHICDGQTWRQAQADGEYRADSLPTEGFIHCSTKEQVLFVANRRFKHKCGLILLAIDSAAVPSKITYENLEGGSQLFPHIYGPLPTAAVKATCIFETGAGGEFVWPAEQLWQEQI